MRDFLPMLSKQILSAAVLSAEGRDAGVVRGGDFYGVSLLNVNTTVLDLENIFDVVDFQDDILQIYLVIHNFHR